MKGTLPSMRGKLLCEAVKKKIKSYGGWGTKFDMSKAGVHFFLCILGMLPRFNFLEIRIFFWKDLPVLGWGRRFLASVSYCTSALLKGVDSAQTLTRKSKGTQLQSPTDLFPDSYLELYRSPMSSPMCSIISCLVGIQ